MGHTAFYATQASSYTTHYSGGAHIKMHLRHTCLKISTSMSITTVLCVFIRNQDASFRSFQGDTSVVVLSFYVLVF